MNPKISAFFDRRNEIEFLERKYGEKGFQLIVIYGRRRVGKTDLITHFSIGKPHIYFLCNKRGTFYNADKFAEKVSNIFNDIKPEVHDFNDVFKYIKNRIGNKKFIVIIDEFSYLVEKDEAISSIFQEITDETLKDSNIMLILCGSSISMMEKGVLTYSSPLYGRRTGQWRVSPLSVRGMMEFFHDNISIGEIIEFYSVVGDIPAYIVKFDYRKSLFENIREKILTKGEFLYDEGRNLLIQEIKEPDSYFDILVGTTKASKAGDIANFARIPAKDLPKYINNLRKLDIVERWSLIAEKKPKKSLYVIKDNFIDFWFRFIYPNLSELEEGKVEYVDGLIKEVFSQRMGSCFERFCLKLINEEVVKFSFKFEIIGRQWGKFKGEKGKNSYEIDIVALNEKTKEILFGECKWEEKVNAKSILNELVKKASYVDWHKGERKEYYVVFAKSFSKKVEEFDGKKVFCFDLKDIERALKKR